MDVTQNLIKAASPEFAAQVSAAGGQGGIAGLVDAAQTEQLKKITDSVVAEAVSVLNGIDSLIHNNTAQVAKLQAEIDKINAASAKANLAKEYFRSTNNLFPARKIIGMPTPSSALAINSKIDVVPEGWTAPAAQAAAQTTAPAAA